MVNIRFTEISKRLLMKNLMEWFIAVTVVYEEKHGMSLAETAEKL